MGGLGTLIAVVALILGWLALGRIKRLEADLTALRSALAEGGVAPPVAAAGLALETSVPEPADPAAETPPEAPARAAPIWARRSESGAEAAPTAPPPPPEPRGPGLGERLGVWLRDNWIYPVAGAALVLAGLFLVQYAYEAGYLNYLGPLGRVMMALVLGAALVGAGEFLRRRPAAGPVLPALLAGAGLVIAMLAVLAALHLYALISPATCLILLALIAFATIALGWLHGPFLSGLGLVAGSAAPFLLGGGGHPPAAIFGYFALLALTGMAIDTARRWGWVTWLALAGPLMGMLLWRQGGGDASAFALAAVVVAGAAMTLPFGRIAPVAEGPMALGRARPVAGVRASFAASFFAAAGAALMVPGIAGPLALTALALLVAFWARRAPALADQMLLPLVAFPVWVVWQVWDYGLVYRAFTVAQAPESAMPLGATLVLAMATLGGLAMIWRGEAEDPGRHAPWTLAGLALPGGTLAALETVWKPGLVIGDYVWALHAMALAALATMLALRYAARDRGADGRGQGPRLGASAASAFALVALGLMLMLGQAALTLALAVLMIGAALMDRRFDIPALGAFLILGALALMWRLVLDPGLGWHIETAGPLAALLALAATLAGPLAALWLIRDLSDEQPRRAARTTVEAIAASAAAIVAAVLVARFLPDAMGAHAKLGLQATVLIALAQVQLARRAGLGGRVRTVLGGILGLAALACLALALTLFSPVFGALSERVTGLPVLNDLLLAYLVPALVLLVFAQGHRLLRLAGWVLAVVWAGMAIRHLWQGPDLRFWRGVEQGELYAYTFALLVAGAVLMARAVQTGSGDLRRLGLVVIGLAAAKAFLIDAAGLDGLLRVAAFLGLGLSLAGLAWLNGWAVAREGSGPGADGGAAETPRDEPQGRVDP